MLTTKQYKFLKKLSKNEIQCDNLIDNRDRIFLYLLNQNYIEKYLVCPDNDIYEKNAKSYCRISQNGEVELKIYKQENYRFWIPTILSIISIIASFWLYLHKMKTYGNSCKNYCNNRKYQTMKGIVHGSIKAVVYATYEIPVRTFLFMLFVKLFPCHFFTSFVC